MSGKNILAAAMVAATMTVTQGASAQSFGPDGAALREFHMRGGYLGVAIIDVDADRVSRLKLTDERGVEVTNLEQGGPADVAGVRPGDVLLTYNGENILGAEQFVRLVRETPAGRKVRMSVWRNGKEQSIVVLTGSPHPMVPNEVANAFSGMNTSSLRGMIVPDVPKLLIIWSTGSLGLECEQVDTQLAQFFGVTQGVLVRSVGKGSVADRAGFKAGDVLTAANNHPVKTPDDLRRVLRSGTSAVPVAITRNHKELTLNLPPPPERDN